MTASPAIALETDSPDVPADDRRWLDRQCARLDRLADLGLEIAEALTAQAKGTRPQAVDGDVALAYGRVSRAVRMAIMLQARLIEDVRRERGKTPTKTEAAEDDAPAQAAERKARAVRIVERVAAAQDVKGFTLGWMRGEARDRLEHDDIYGDVMAWPLSELVAAICADLGLTPDWARLAEEAWALDEIDSGEAGWPLRDDAEDPGPEPAPRPPAPPTLHERLQELAADPAILAAAGPRHAAARPPPLAGEGAFGCDTR